MLRMTARFIGALILLSSGQAYAATVYADRPDFEAALGTSITDDYENSGYVFLQDNLTMSSILGETTYRTTGFQNWNIVVFDSFYNTHVYCAGCKGSFTLDFTSTTVGNATGVFGVGLDILINGGFPLYTAFVTYGDQSTQDFLLPQLLYGDGGLFFGLTSESNIASIAFGPGNGGTTVAGGIEIDNLTIGSPAVVPLPAALPLFASGLIGLGGSRAKSKIAARLRLYAAS